MHTCTCAFLLVHSHNLTLTDKNRKSTSEIMKIAMLSCGITFHISQNGWFVTFLHYCEMLTLQLWNGQSKLNNVKCSAFCKMTIHCETNLWQKSLPEVVTHHLFIHTFLLKKLNFQHAMHEVLLCIFKKHLLRTRSFNIRTCESLCCCHCSSSCKRPDSATFHNGPQVNFLF